jgi:acyl-CoA thioesterase FadM
VLPFIDFETGVTLNAARYFAFADIVQNECNLRSGFIGAGLKNGLWAIAVANSIIYRKPFKRFSKIFVTAELIGWDDRFYVWQSTFRNGNDEIWAVSFTKVSVRSKQGLIGVNECFQMMQVEPYVRHLRKDVDALFGQLETIALTPSTRSTSPA